MSVPHLGLTNPYLKFGLGFIALALVLMGIFIATSNGIALYAGGIFFWSGVVLYIGGRIAKARRPSDPR